MATTTTTITKLLAFVFVVIVLLENSHAVSSTTSEPTISASPGVLPYVTSPDISSFFPTPMSSSEAPYNAEASAPAPAPSSGEKSSSSTRLDCVAAIVGIMLSSVFLSVIA